MPRLRRLIARHAEIMAAPTVVETSLPGVRLALSGSMTQPACDMVQPTFALVIQGAKRTVVGDRTLTYRAGQYLVATAEVPVTGAVLQAPFAALVMRLDPTAVAALLHQAEPQPSRPEPVEALV